MSGFPLYDNLIQKLPKKDLTVKQKEEFINISTTIDLNGKELIYALVHVFYTQNTSGDMDNDLPFDGSKEQSDDKKSQYTVTWNFMNFPVKLRQLLYKFVTLHVKTLQEDDTRSMAPP